MKKIILFFAAALILYSASAQWGVKAGANFSTLTGNQTGGLKHNTGVYGGVFYNARINGMFSFQPELVYSGQGAKVITAETWKLIYLNLTGLFRYNHTSGLFVGTGPQFGILLSAKGKEGSSSVDMKDNFKSTDISWAFALGYEMKNGFGLYGRYNLGLSDINALGYGDKFKNSVIQVGLRYSFLSKNK